MKKRKPKGWSEHHRRPQAQGGTRSFPANNISLITQVKHDAWNALFEGTLSPFEIARIINETFLDPEYSFFVVATNNKNIYKKDEGSQF